MKIQHYAIVFIIIVLPFSIVCRSIMNEKIDALNDETRINNVVDTATTDAVDDIIYANEIFYGMYEGETIDVTPPLAMEGIETFFKTMAINFNLPYTKDNEYIKDYFAAYVPAVIVVAYDGFYIYSLEENSSTKEFEYVLSPKIPYAYEVDDEGELKKNYIDEAEAEYKEIHDILGGNTLTYLPQLTEDMSIIIFGLKDDGIAVPDFLNIANSSKGVSMLNDYKMDRPYDEVSEFHKVRRSVIAKLISETLNEKMNNHNRYADMMGITYDFFLPEIDDDEWINAIDDVSVMSFIQGIPIGHKSYYNNYALGSSRIVRRDFVYGTADKFYHKRKCPLISSDIDDEGYPTSSLIESLFINKSSAALAGYYPCAKCQL